MVATVIGRAVTLRVSDFPLIASGTVTFEYSGDSGETWVTIASNVSPTVTDSGLDTETVITVCEWVVDAALGEYVLRYTDNSTGDFLTEDFIVVPSVAVGQVKTLSIEDVPLDTTQTVDIHLSRDNGETWELIADNVLPTVTDYGLDTEAVVTSYDWTVSGDLSDMCIIRFTDNGTAEMFTDRQFAIVASSGGSIVIDGAAQAQRATVYSVASVNIDVGGSISQGSPTLYSTCSVLSHVSGVIVSQSALCSGYLGLIVAITGNTFSVPAQLSGTIDTESLSIIGNVEPQRALFMAIALVNVEIVGELQSLQPLIRVLLPDGGNAAHKMRRVRYRFSRVSKNVYRA